MVFCFGLIICRIHKQLLFFSVIKFENQEKFNVWSIPGHFVGLVMLSNESLLCAVRSNSSLCWRSNHGDSSLCMTSSFYENPMFPHVHEGGHVCGGGFWQRTCYGNNIPKLVNVNNPPSNETTLCQQVANKNFFLKRHTFFVTGRKSMKK